MNIVAITVISVERVNTMANQRCLRLFRISVPTGIAVGTFDNTSSSSMS